nr:uncharacterized protein CTRU02_10646 [Colletotrichum truncatum]KAF6786947.1 hypothetical protein CTRU02_10646 [Colletotrichum truncatum]
MRSRSLRHMWCLPSMLRQVLEELGIDSVNGIATSCRGSDYGFRYGVVYFCFKDLNSEIIESGEQLLQRDMEAFL